MSDVRGPFDFAICYAGDDESTARALYLALTGAGAAVFFAPESIGPGRDWQESLRAAIRTSSSIVVLVSEHSGTAHYQKEEIHEAINTWRAKRGLLHIIPVLLSGRSQASPGFGLSSFQALNLSELGSIEALARKLLQQDTGGQARLELLVDELEAEVVERERHREDGLGQDQREERINDLAWEIRQRCRFEPGETVAGTKLERPVGRGNFGTVWLATDIESGERRATKVFDLNSLAQGIMLWRFRRSIKAIRQLNSYRDCPAEIVRLHQSSHGNLAFSMDYLSGRNLEDVKTRGWSIERKIEILLSVARATSFAHAIGVIHRDIKPANIVLDEQQRPVLTDFDIADIRFVTSLSISVGGLGTPVFAAPEQQMDANAASELSDVFSLGRLLHFLLLERSPPLQIEDDPKLGDLSPHPPALVETIRRATQSTPKKRFDSVKSLISGIEQYQSTWSVAKARLQSSLRWVRMNRTILSIIVLLLVGAWSFAIYQAGVAQKQARLRERLDGIVEELDAWQLAYDDALQQKQSLQLEITRLEGEQQILQDHLNSLPVGDPDRQSLSEQLERVSSQINEKESELARINQQLESTKREIEERRQEIRKLREEEFPGGSTTATAGPREPIPGVLPAARVGEPYDQQIRIENAASVQSWSSDSDLPAGLELRDGRVSGIPVASGQWPLRLRASQKDGTERIVDVTLEVLGRVRPSAEISSADRYRCSVGERFAEALQLSRPMSAITWQVSEGSALPEGLSLSPGSGEIHGVPRRAGRSEVTFRAEYAGSDDPEAPVWTQPRTVTFEVSNGGCERPTFARCGEHCEDLSENPFHWGQCFRVADDLTRKAATDSDSPPPWKDPGRVPRRYYRLFYEWNADQSAVRVLDLGESRWSTPPVEDEARLLFEIPRAELLEGSYQMVVAELAIHCDGPVRVGDYRTAVRGAYERLSTDTHWERRNDRQWTRTPDVATDKGLAATMDPLLSRWSGVCESSSR